MNHQSLSAVDPGPIPPPSAARLQRFLAASKREDFAAALAEWNGLERAPRTHREALLAAEAAAHVGDERFPQLIEHVPSDTEKALLGGIWQVRRGLRAEAALSFERGFVLARTDPLARLKGLELALAVSVDLGSASVETASRLMNALSEPFAGEAVRGNRVQAYVLHAMATHDARRCVEAIDRGAPIERTRQLLEIRASCLARAGDPRQDQAAAELGELIVRTRAFGDDIPAPR